MLTKGGRILNFDANYGAAFIASDADGIAADLYVSRQDRPSWDISVLLHNGITKVWLDMDIEKRVPFGHTVKKRKNRSTTANTFRRYSCSARKNDPLNKVISFPQAGHFFPSFA